MPITVKKCTRMGMNYEHQKIGSEMKQEARGYIASKNLTEIVYHNIYKTKLLELTVMQMILNMYCRVPNIG